MAENIRTTRYTERQQKAAAKKFAEKWHTAAGKEKTETSRFWTELLRKVYGVQDVEDIVLFERGVALTHQSYIDIQLPDTHVVIEQKSADVDLGKKQRQSDGSFLTPYEQAKRYADNLKYRDRARWIVTCNFREFQVHDMDADIPSKPVCVLKLENLPDHIHTLDFLVDAQISRVALEKKVSIQAGNIISRVYKALLQKSNSQGNPRLLHDLNKFCVRLVFCLYAEDAGLFKHKQFFNYLSKARTPDDMEQRMQLLFHALNQPQNERNPLKKDLLEFPYVNGGLFDDAELFIPDLDDELCDLILNQASDGFNWKDISPTIFGSLFERTLNTTSQQQGGMYYTSIENIHKVIDPLFMNALHAKLENIRTNINSNDKKAHELHALQDEIASLTFLDPACGSGNFLTETFICLRRLENQILAELQELEKYKNRPVGRKQGRFGGEFSQIKVSINQFFGIEINDFAVSVAKTALWIADAQMWEEAQEYSLIETSDFLPLGKQNGIREGNALQVDWLEGLPDRHVDFVIGNPPFVGYSEQTHEQKTDLMGIFEGQQGAGLLDYVSAWFMKAVDIMKEHPCTRTALVATNSITQGQQVAILWPSLLKMGCHIDFAYRSFKWQNATKKTAAVHCVIIGFSCGGESSQKILVDEQGEMETVEHINCYLANAEDVFIAIRRKPLCDVPQIICGSKPAGNFFFSEEEYREIERTEPRALPYLRRVLGAEEFLHGITRYCLWLTDAPLHEVREIPIIRKRIAAIKKNREASTKKATRKCAATPYLFQEIRQPKSDYIIVPCTTSENREYIPIGFEDASIIVTNLVTIIPNATLYHFGVLTSWMHMVWMRSVCGRREMRYRYTNTGVYNNFPWPTPTAAQKREIEKYARAVLDARDAHHGASMKAMYEDDCMEIDLKKAHQNLDAAVERAYGKKFQNDAARMAHLFRMYQELVQRDAHS